MNEPLFFAEAARWNQGVDQFEAVVRKRPEKTDRGVIPGFEVCPAEQIETAEQIAHALNRLPEAEALVLRLVQAIGGQADPCDDALVACVEAEAWMLAGVS